MREKNINKVLKEVDDTLLVIGESYMEAAKDDKIKEVVEVKVKNTIENLRSCLDYILHDIDECILRNHRKVLYFPYKDTKNDFKQEVKIKFKGLRNKSPQIYSILESIQDFNNKDNPWLGVLCRKTNKVKHDDLLEQERKDYYSSYLPDLGMEINDNAKVIFKSSKMRDKNGDLIPLDFTVNSKGVVDSKGPIDKRITIENISWVTFTINGTNQDVLEFLTHCRNEMGEMMRKVYEQIKKNKCNR
ncbi:hypothetical protein [Priestia aryabhattai]|uniref:hypothetical protein n=1 Tax=Priestia aryabhattai TaxID=412384 RepID=UPI003C8664AC